MSELAFCKTFLSAIDARPIKLSSDYISDARTYPAAGVPILPRLPAGHPARPNPKDTAGASSSSTVDISLKPMKPSTPTVPLSAIDPAKTSVYDLKTQYATATSIPVAKIKILYKKKPVTDSKTVSEIIGADAGGEVEFGVMVMGGATAGTPSGNSPVASPPAAAPSEADKGLAAAASEASNTAPVAAGPSGKEVVATDEFWTDLHNFVMQRTKDEHEADRLVGVFKSAWESNK